MKTDLYGVFRPKGLEYGSKHVFRSSIVTEVIRDKERYCYNSNIF